MKEIHTPVLLQEVIEWLSPSENKNFVDATLGFAGHASEILNLTGPNGILIGIDQDETAVKSATDKLAEFGGRVRIFQGNFDQIREASRGVAITGGIIADLGVSSLQLDEATRGFSFGKNGPLDMRMDQTGDLTAAEIVNTYSENELTEIIRKYGEERFAARIAGRIIKNRTEKPFETTLELAETVAGSIPRKFWPKSINPATRTFQAIRIAVNDELGALERFLPQAVDILEPGARIGVITFHGLEDKIVKDFLQKEANPCTCPPEFPKCICGKVSKIKILTKKGIRPTEAEIKENPRSRSAKLRIVEKRSAIGDQG